MQKGNYYKIKTKKWFEDKGYKVEYLEKLQRLYTPQGRIIWTKKDILASDGISLNKNELIFWNSKLNKKNIAKGIKEYKKIPFPKYIKQWIIIWQPRVRDPEIIEVEKI